MNAMMAVAEQCDLGTVDNYVMTTHNSGNDVFLGDEYVVKVFTKQKGDGSHKEARLCDALRHKLPTPEIAAIGKTSTGAPYIVIHRIPGTALQLIWNDLSDQEKRRYVARVGATLATTHNSTDDVRHILPEPQAPLRQNLRHRTASALDAVAARQMLSPRVLAKLRNYFDTHIAEISDVPLTFLHGGFRYGNLVVADGNITGVIDWEDASLGDPAEELALVLYRTVPEEYHAIFLDSYKAVRQLPDGLDTLYRFYPLLYYLRFLPDIATWTQFPTKQTYYTRETEKLLREIINEENQLHHIK